MRLREMADETREQPPSSPDEPQEPPPSVRGHPPAWFDSPGALRRATGEPS